MLCSLLERHLTSLQPQTLRFMSHSRGEHLARHHTEIKTGNPQGLNTGQEVHALCCVLGKWKGAGVKRKKKNRSFSKRSGRCGFKTGEEEKWRGRREDGGRVCLCLCVLCLCVCAPHRAASGARVRREPHWQLGISERANKRSGGGEGGKQPDAKCLETRKMLKGQKYRGVERPSGRKVLKGSVRVQCQKTENVLEFSGRGRILLTRGWGRGGAKQVNLLLRTSTGCRLSMWPYSGKLPVQSLLNGMSWKRANAKLILSDLIKLRILPASRIHPFIQAKFVTEPLPVSWLWTNLSLSLEHQRRSSWGHQQQLIGSQSTYRAYNEPAGFHPTPRWGCWCVTNPLPAAVHVLLLSSLVVLSVVCSD